MTLVHTEVAAPAVIVDHIRRLVECESPSADTAAVARSAEQVAALGVELLGAEPERLVVDGTTHLRWRFGDTTRVLLLTHHDTVWPVGSLATHPFAVRDGVLTGPGSFDMKVGLVMALHAVAGLPDRDGVTILVTGDEEVGSPTSRALIESEAAGARAALVTEASGDGGALKIERKGTSIYEVRVTGRAAHAGLEPEKGVNATLELAHQALAVAGLGDAELGTTVTPTVIGAGTTTNTVPAAGSFVVDVRVCTIAEQDRVDAAMHALGAVLPSAVVEVVGGPNRPPLESASSSELFGRAQSIAAGLGLQPLVGIAVGGASDGNFTAGIGVPTLDGLGAVGGGAHADDEHVLVGAIAPRTALLSALIFDLLEQGGLMTGTDLRPADEAVSSAEAAADAARVTVRELARIEDLNDTVHLLSDIWGRTGNPPVTPELLRAFSKAGNYIGGAFDGETLVGATIAFHSTPERHSLHSHIAGVTPGLIGRSVGFAMKLHQRAWALDRGIATIEWTFDPLVARNAYFNIVKLGAVPVEYLRNFYGVMSDVINGDDETDRLLMRWALTDPLVVSAAATGRIPAAEVDRPDRVTVGVPADIEAMRAEEPELAHEWRVRVRERLTELLADGGRIIGFDRVRGYVLDAGSAEVTR